VGVTLKLSQLQNLCKRDPAGYREDYDAQVRRLESEFGILALQASSSSSEKSEKRLEELIQFAAAVSSSSYKGPESDRIAGMLMGVLVGMPPDVSSAASSAAAASPASSQPHMVTMPTAALQLPKDVRKSIVSALILMRNKGAVEPLQLLELFFRIMAVVPDKALREMLHRHIVNDIRNINKKGKRDDKVNRAIQSFFHRVVSTHGTSSAPASSSVSAEESATDIAAKRATDMVCELYRRRVWTDDKTVAILASAVDSGNATVMCRALRFFLGIEEKMAQDAAQQEEDDWETKNRIDYHSHSRKTAARQRHVRRQLKSRKKLIDAKRKQADADSWAVDFEDPEEDRGVEAGRKLYPAIELLRDPQGLAESVLKRMRHSSSSYKYEVKLLMMNFVTRLVGNHQLLLLPLYSFLAKYLSGHQRDVTAVLAYTVQACHEYVPPDEAYTLLKTIAHNFITERCSEEQMAVGINAARAICTRVPSVMSVEESDETAGSTVMDIEAFARDLAAYSNHRDRSVSIAGKSWTNFVREVNPGLLQGRDRGLKGTAMHKAGAKPLRYGEQRTAMGVEGADLLAEYEAKKRAARRRKKAQPDGEADAASDDDDGWEEVEEDDGVDDSDDESAPNLVLLGKDNEVIDEAGDNASATEVAAETAEEAEDEEEVLDVSKMSPAERQKLKQEMSSTRIFSASDFEKMRRLVEREEKLKRDPREAARRKRVAAKGQDFEDLSGADSSDGADSDDDEQVRVSGAVNPTDIMAQANRKRLSKAEKLKQVIANKTEFETKQREGGSTNIEKKRKKNFLMTKFSREARTKGRGKAGLRQKRRDQTKMQMGHEAKKRRRKM